MDAAYWEAMMRGLVATLATWAELIPAPATPPPTSRPTVRPSASPSATGTATVPADPPSATPTPTERATEVPGQGLIRLPICYRPRR